METTVKDRFLRKKAQKDSENSIKSYKVSIEKFYNEFEEAKGKIFNTDVELIKETSSDDFEDYYYNLSENYKKSTVNLRVLALKQLFDYAMSKNIITENPTLSVDLFTSYEIKRNTKQKESLTIQEIKKMLNCSYVRGKAEKNFEWNSSRDRCLIAILSTSGVRISEALSIQMSDIEKTELGYVINIHEDNVKNNIAKRVPITEGIEIYFREYYNALRVEGHKEGYLFFTKTGKEMYYTDAEKIINKLVRKAGIEKKITAHSFRHTLTQILLQKEVNESIIYKILGWSESKMISQYNGAADDPKFDELKFKHCNILA